MYDPRACGAQCNNCPLKGSVPVAPQSAQGATVLLVGESPSVDDVLQQGNFSGRSGQEIDLALARIGVHRSQVSLTHAVLCRPADNDMGRLLKALKAQNKARKEKGEPQLLTPVEYCRPRLQGELRKHHYVVAMGKEANLAVTGQKEPILNIRGTMTHRTLPQLGDKPPHTFKLVPTVHPIMISRAERWRWPFRSDIAKAWRFFTGTLVWDEPELLYNPPVETLRQLLLTREPLTINTTNADGTARESVWTTERLPPHIGGGLEWQAYDKETQHKLSSLDAHPRCVAIGTAKWAVVISITSIEETRRWWRAFNRGDVPLPEQNMVYGDAWPLVLDVLDAWAQDPTLCKVGWNSGYYDRQVWEQWRGYTPTPELDLINLWRDCASELPKSLGFVGTYLLDAPDWKGDHTATQTDSDSELWTYNGFDTCITGRLVGPIIQILAQRGQNHHVEPNHKVQDMCADMHRNGLWINQDRRERTEKWLGALRTSTERTCQRTASRYGLDGHNPRSFVQVANLLYNVWEYLPPFETPAGEPSTGEDAVLALLRDRRCTDDQREYLEALLLHRNVSKRHSTYCKPMRPENVWWRARDDIGRSFLDAAAIRSRGELRHGRVMLSDERLHPGYSSHIVVSHRLSSQKINAQNLEKIFRYLIQPPATARSRKAVP